MKTRTNMWLLVITFFSMAAYALPPGIKHYDKRANAPKFVMTDTDNKVHKLEDYRGQVLIMNFWATWCVPCRKEMPALKAAWIKLSQGGVKMLGVATRDKMEDVAEFKHDYAVDFPLPMDPDGNVASNWSVLAVPTAYVVDPDGRVAMRIIGGYEWENMDLIKSIIDLKGTKENKTAGIDQHIGTP